MPKRKSTTFQNVSELIPVCESTKLFCQKVKKTTNGQAAYYYDLRRYYVASNESGDSEELVPTRRGLFCTLEEVEKLVQVLQKLLKSDPQKKAKKTVNDDSE